jgi:hypothetical protein
VYRRSKWKIKPSLHAIGVHAGEQYFSSAKLLPTLRPLERVELLGVPTSPRIDLPTIALASRVYG